jgi:hypothetical protein
MTNKSLEVCYDFPFFMQEELDEIFKAHEKTSFQKGDFILEEGKQPMNTIFWTVGWPVHLSMILTETK